MASRLKGWATPRLPEKWRMARYERYETVRYYPKLLLSLGARFERPFCRWCFRRLGWLRPPGSEGGGRRRDESPPGRCLSEMRVERTGKIGVLLSEESDLRVR